MPEGKACAGGIFFVIDFFSLFEVCVAVKRIRGDSFG